MGVGKKILVWVLRLIVGGTFTFSGFAKAVDPWGFVYKIQEYLMAWNWDGIPREILLCIAIGIAMIEFVSGVMLLMGCIRRACVWALSAMMAVMLPLTFYIMEVNPVADCGCFGDAWILSNTATFVKNLVLSCMLVCLLKWNVKVAPLVSPLMQWVPLTLCVLYSLALSFIGWWIQPIVDFRPFPVGEPLLSEEADVEDIKLVYEKDGVEASFSMEDLPDSTWTYLRREGRVKAGHAFSIFEGDEDVTDVVIASEGPQLLLVVSNPQWHSRARSHMCNNLCEMMDDSGSSMLGLVPLQDEALEQWKSLANPEYEVLTVEDTQLKELARGDAALVYLNDGIVRWKRNLYSLPSSFMDHIESMDQIYVVDDGSLLWAMTGGLVLLLVLSCFMLPNGKKKS